MDAECDRCQNIFTEHRALVVAHTKRNRLKQVDPPADDCPVRRLRLAHPRIDQFFFDVRNYDTKEVLNIADDRKNDIRDILDDYAILSAPLVSSLLP